MHSLETLFALATAASDRGDKAAAIAGFRQVGASFPAQKSAVLPAAQGLRTCGDPAAAADLLETFLAMSPGSLAALNILAAAYADLKRPDAVAATFERLATALEHALLSSPAAATWAGLGEVRSRLGQWTLAEAAFRQGVILAPRDSGLLFNLAQALRNLGRAGAAEAVLAQVLAVEPTHAGAGAAMAALPPAPAGDPDAMADEGWSADRKGLYGAARAKYEDALRARSGLIFALSRLLTLDCFECRLDEAETRHRDLIAGLERADFDKTMWEVLALIAYHSTIRPIPHALYRRLTQALGRKLAAVAGPPRRTKPRDAAGRRLKIGYLSAYFCDHPLGHNTHALFAAHDRERFEVYVFGPPEGSPNRYTHAVATTVEHYISLPNAPAHATDVIADCDLDILVYHDGYTTHALLPVIAARPAPIQVFWLGHAGGCDLPAIDYMIADAIVAPPDEDSRYRAKVVRLPDTFHCVSPQPIGPPMTRAEAGLPAEGFVFCGFNNPEKIDRSIFDSWMRILARVDGSILWLSRGHTSIVADNLRTAALARGIAGERLVFADRLPDKARHLARHGLCGLLLDTPFLNASTTALDALWSGLPVLTTPGPVFGARLAASHLHALGLDDMIMESRQAYEDRAVHLATHPEDLAEIQGRLASARYSHPLFDINIFCRNLEAGLEGIYRDHPRS